MRNIAAPRTHRPFFRSSHRQIATFALFASCLWSTAQAAPATPPTSPPTSPPADLAARLAALAAETKGTTGIAVTHIESGRTSNWNADALLPTFSVMKLPVAIAVLTEVAAGRLTLDKSVHVTPADVVRGAPGSAERWADTPKDVSVTHLLDLSVTLSDNTSADKLLALLGGPPGVMRKLQALHLDGLKVRGSYHTDDPKHFNLGSASAITRLLTRLWQGQLLAPPQRDLLVGFMTKSPNGARRLRGKLPAGTVVADKTGTGGEGRATNDVGIITLPGGQGHLAIAVLINGSPLPQAQQEDLIAAIARAAYDAHTAAPQDAR
jgi:beta-lactamase class A